MSEGKLKDRLKAPQESTCAMALKEMGDLETVALQWRPLQAPGSQLKPAADQRQTAGLMEGWTKIVMSSAYPDIDGDDTMTNTLNGWKILPLPRETDDVCLTRGQNLPDQWSIDRNYHHAWYGIKFELNANGPETCWLIFDAVSHACAVFINGQEAGRHLGGYTPFEINLAGLCQPGENVLMLWVQDDTAVFGLENRRCIGQLDYGRGAQNAHFAGIRGGVYLEMRRAAHVENIRVRSSTRNNKGCSGGEERALRLHPWLNKPE